MDKNKNGDKRVLKDEETTAGRGIKRPLIPLVLALMLGLAAADWGLHIPKFWLLATLAGLLAVFCLLYFLSYFKGPKAGPPE